MLSIIIPFHNEEENLPILYRELKNVLKSEKLDYEIVFIDDGSEDESEKVVLNLKKKDQSIIFVQHQRRLGKGQALATGVKNSRGDILVFMDSDLQDNPAEIPNFLRKIEGGYDLVNGVRLERKHNVFLKLHSYLGNLFVRALSNSPFHDINCGFKILKRKILDDMVLYGNNFRFLPLAAYYKGYRVTEIGVNHRMRMFGKAKYGIGKGFIGFLDTLTATFLYKFSEQPLHFFGAIGGVFFILGFTIALYLSIERLFFGVMLFRRPALLLAVLLIIVGVQIVVTGILGELMVYINKKSK